MNDSNLSISILLMVPMYSITSFLSLRYIRHAVYFDAIRSCYEAFVIYSFYALLLSYLGSDHEAQKASMQRKPDGRYPFPFNCYLYNPRTSKFLTNCTRRTLQYALIHPFTTLVYVILEISGSLCPEQMDMKHPSFYLLTIDMISVSVAMYYLVLFFLVVNTDLARYRPMWKFLAVKFVIFFSFCMTTCEDYR